MKKKLVVVGNGMAGMRTVEKLWELQPDLYEITVIGKEHFTNYNRIMLSPVLSGEKELSQIILHDHDWYASRGIHLVMGDAVAAIDRKKEVVTTEKGLIFKYDRLLLATGSSPLILPIKGIDHSDVMTFRDISDVERLKDCAKKVKKIAVIGGGLLGLEAAYGLNLQGMEVHIIHNMPFLMNRQLDEVSGALLKKELEKKGINVLTGRLTEEILSDASGKVSGIKFKNAETLAVDAVVVAVGIIPNISLAKSAYLACERGILVNDTMQTFDPKIYAVGECVQHRKRLFGLVQPLYQQAWVCATHLAEKGVSLYQFEESATTLKVSGVRMLSAGEVNPEGMHESIYYVDGHRSIYKKLIIQNDCISAICLLGDVTDGPWYYELMKSKQNITAIRDQLIFGQNFINEACFL